MLLESLSRPCFASLLPIPVPWTAHIERPQGLPKLPEFAFLFHRIDPSRNMLRFYQLELLPDMFGGVLLIREWSRIGSRGQYKARWFDDPAAANGGPFHPGAAQGEARLRSVGRVEDPARPAARCPLAWRRPPRKGAMPARARASAPSFIGWPLWPRTQVHLIAGDTTIMSSCCQRSAFLTESLLTVRQPRAFHPLIQLVAPSRRYCELVTTSTAQARVSASIPLKRPGSPCGCSFSAPKNSFSASP